MARKSYRIKAGDNIYTIAAALGITAQQLMEQIGAIYRGGARSVMELVAGQVIAVDVPELAATRPAPGSAYTRPARAATAAPVPQRLPTSVQQPWAPQQIIRGQSPFATISIGGTAARSLGYTPEFLVQRFASGDFPVALTADQVKMLVSMASQYSGQQLTIEDFISEYGYVQKGGIFYLNKKGGGADSAGLPTGFKVNEQGQIYSVAPVNRWQKGGKTFQVIAHGNPKTPVPGKFSGYVPGEGGKPGYYVGYDPRTGTRTPATEWEKYLTKEFGTLPDERTRFYMGW